MAADVWEASNAGSDAGAGLPGVGDLVGRLMRDVQEAPVPHLAAGAGYAVVQLPLFILLVIGMYGGAFAGMFWAMETLGEDEIGLGILAGTLAGASVTALPMAVVLPPLTASLYRAVYAWQARGEPLGFGSAFSTATQDIGRTYLTTIALSTIIFAGLLLCYVPGLLLAFVLHFAYMRVVIHRRGVIDAIQDSWGHAAAHPGWNLGVFGVAFLISLALSNIPFLGVVVATVAVCAWNLHAYRAAFPEPVEVTHG